MPLAERMILALEAGYAKGGDKRWGNLQSAAIKVADPNDPGRGNDHITLAIEVGEHPDPVAEMKRIYYTTGRRLGYRSFSRIEGAGRHRAEADAARASATGGRRSRRSPMRRPSPTRRKMQELRKTDPAAVREGADRGAAAGRRLPRATSGSTTRKRSPPWTSSAPTRTLNYQGNPPGLVDAAARRRAAGGVSREEEGQALAWPR